MERAQIESKIIEIMKTQEIVKEDANIDASALIKEDLGMNSIKMVKLLVMLELEFDIEFEDFQLDVKKYKDINSIIDTVIQNMKK